MILTTDVVSSDLPLLLSKHAMKKMGVKMDLVQDTAEIFGKEVAWMTQAQVTTLSP